MRSSALAWLAACWLASFVFPCPSSIAAEDAAVTPVTTAPQPAIAVDENYMVVKEAMDVMASPERNKIIIKP